MRIFAATALVLTLAACGAEPQPAAPANEADDFAARINGSGTAAPAQPGSGDGTPTVAQPLPNAAPGVFTPGTATDPASATCGANQMGMFIGKPANADARNQIYAIISGNNEIRFVEPGSANFTPDASVPRLNIMLDAQGIIRDARCG